MQRALLKGTAVSGLAATLVLAGCGGAATPPASASASASASAPASTSAPSTFNVGGRLDLSMVKVWQPGTACQGEGGYDDVVGGAQVKILDATGAVIAFGNLSSGMSVQLFDVKTGSSHCRFTFSVLGVPAKGDIYGVEVAQRGVVQFQKSNAEKLQLSLG